MDTHLKKQKAAVPPTGADFFEHMWAESWTYIKTVVDVIHEPVLILDKELHVMAANEPFYRTFQVDPKETEGQLVYRLGNGQWDVPGLRQLLEDVLPKNTFFKGFEVNHTFPTIGRKIMILNARQIYFQEHAPSKLLPPIILLAIEDVSDMMDVAETLANHTSRLEEALSEKTAHMERQIQTLEQEIKILRSAS